MDEATVSFEHFSQLEIRIGKVIRARKITDADKLMELIFDCGDHERQIIAGIAEFCDPEDLLGKEMPIVCNLEPKVFRGHTSNGMLMAADVEGRPVFLRPEEEIPPGSRVF